MTTAILAAARVSSCRDCRGHIRWALTLDSKRMPFDAEPSSEGNLAVFLGAAHGGLLCRVITASEPLLDGEVQCMPHFATCSARRNAQRPPTSLPAGVVSLNAHRRRRSAKAGGA